MISIVKCTYCGNSGSLNIEMSVTYDQNRCDCCHRLEQSKWGYHFCNVTCQFKWMVENDILNKGVECKGCKKGGGESTGFAFGFESNGICKTCNGEKRVKI